MRAARLSIGRYRAGARTRFGANNGAADSLGRGEAVSNHNGGPGAALRPDVDDSEHRGFRPSARSRGTGSCGWRSSMSLDLPPLQTLLETHVPLTAVVESR